MEYPTSKATFQSVHEQQAPDDRRTGTRTRYRAAEHSAGQGCPLHPGAQEGHRQAAQHRCRRHRARLRHPRQPQPGQLAAGRLPPADGRQPQRQDHRHRRHRRLPGRPAAAAQRLRRAGLSVRHAGAAVCRAARPAPAADPPAQHQPDQGSPAQRADPRHDEQRCRRTPHRQAGPPPAGPQPAHPHPGRARHRPQNTGPLLRPAQRPAPRRGSQPAAAGGHAPDHQLQPLHPRHRHRGDLPQGRHRVSGIGPAHRHPGERRTARPHHPDRAALPHPQ